MRNLTCISHRNIFKNSVRLDASLHGKWRSDLAVLFFLLRHIKKKITRISAPVPIVPPTIAPFLTLSLAIWSPSEMIIFIALDYHVRLKVIDFNRSRAILFLSCFNYGTLINNRARPSKLPVPVLELALEHPVNAIKLISEIRMFTWSPTFILVLNWRITATCFIDVGNNRKCLSVVSSLTLLPVKHWRNENINTEWVVRNQCLESFHVKNDSVCVQNIEITSWRFKYTFKPFFHDTKG